METFSRLLDIERNSPSGGNSESLMTQNVAAMLTSLKFTVATAPVDVPRLGHYDGKNAEPRASELLAIALGKDSRALQEVLDQNPFAGATDGSQPDQPRN